MDEVISEQKERTARIFQKFYRLLKSIRREKMSAGSNNPSMQNFDNAPSKGFIDLIITLCRDSFNLLGGGKGTLGISEVSKFCQLIGKDMEKDEFYFFFKKCMTGDNTENGGGNTNTNGVSAFGGDDNAPLLFTGKIISTSSSQNFRIFSSLNFE